MQLPVLEVSSSRGGNGARMDLADIVESLRGVLRGLCTGVVRLPIEDAYGENVTDVPRIRNLVETLRARAEVMDEQARQEALVGASSLEVIAAQLDADPFRPSDEELCERYVDGMIDARTVLVLTGWSLDRLHDECEKISEEPTA